MIGKLFNQRYQIKEKLGSGGTAVVYKGQDTLLGRLVTIKILREEYASNEEFVRRFRREAQAVASLSHGNIVAVYDVGYEENMHYIVMEFVEGQSLKEYIKAQGRMEVQEAASVMMQILDGIGYAHEHGIVHRDIKPHNILLGTDGRAKVTDFGIAVGMTDMTQTYNTSSRIMGSVHYIAPEQVQGQPVTEKSDIYSAGVVFYEMLTGQLPFNGDTPISIAMQHVQGELILPHQLNHKIPMGLSYVVMRAMRKNPETRYDSAKEMAEAIRSVAEGLSSVYAPLPDENLEHTRELAEPLPGGEVLERYPREHALRDRTRPKRAPREHAPREGRMESNAPRRRVNVMSVIMAVVMLALVGLLTAAVIWAMGQFKEIVTPEAKIEVPNLLGYKLADAEAELAERGLRVPTVVRRNDETIPIDTVMQQNPTANTEVGAEREITLTVSDGPRLTEVPNVVGYGEMAANTMLGNKGLVPVYLEAENNEDFPAGDIFWQNPAAGEPVRGGTAVELKISLGPEAEPVPVPKVTEQSLTDATMLLQEAGLLVGTIKHEESSVYYADIVIAQSAPAGSELNPGDAVNLTVSRGPGPTIQSTTVSYDVPNDGMSHNVRIVVNDSQGTHEPFNQDLSPGYPLREQVKYYGQGTITVYLDGEAVGTMPVGGQ